MKKEGRNQQNFEIIYQKLWFLRFVLPLFSGGFEGAAKESRYIN